MSEQLDRLYEKAVELGKMQILVELINEGNISVEDAAGCMEISVEEFLKKKEEYEHTQE